MIEPNDALKRLRRANLLPPGAPPDGEELAAVVAECEQRVDVERGVAAPGARNTEDSLRPVAATRTRWRPALVFSLAFLAVIAVVAVAALFNDSGGAILESDVANTVPPITSGLIGNVAYIDDLVYYEDAERTLETSLYLPAEGNGPFPVVIIYSEHTLNAREGNLARQIAERGAIAFAPVWVDESPPTQTASEYLSGAMWDRASCAVGYAQARAETYGGDPARTTVMGDAGGEHPAAWVALGLADTSDCTEPILFQPTGLVAGESQWLFQEEQFDEAFEGQVAVGVDTVDRFFNPERWDSAKDLSVFLWATTWSGNSTGITDPPPEDSWIWSRDPDGDLVEDLAAEEAFADGLITFSDNSRLMQIRMKQAGIDVSYYESDDPGYSLDNFALDNIWQLVAGG